MVSPSTIEYVQSLIAKGLSWRDIMEAADVSAYIVARAKREMPQVAPRLPCCGSRPVQPGAPCLACRLTQSAAAA